MSELHNDYVTRTIMAAGPGLVHQGGFSAQMEAIESILAGLMAVAAKTAGKSPADADAYLSAVTHGARPRLRELLKDKH